MNTCTPAMMMNAIALNAIATRLILLMMLLSALTSTVPAEPTPFAPSATPPHAPVTTMFVTNANNTIAKTVLLTAHLVNDATSRCIFVAPSIPDHWIFVIARIALKWP